MSYIYVYSVINLKNTQMYKIFYYHSNITTGTVNIDGRSRITVLVMTALGIYRWTCRATMKLGHVYLSVYVIPHG